jgi:acyl carrier protein
MTREESQGMDYETYLKRRLPAHMVPGIYVERPDLPLTPNGKIDRKRLSDPGAQRKQRKYTGPRNIVEARLCAIWAEVLGLERVGIDDNFFELGGHSLIAGRVIARIRHDFQIELSLRSIFEAPLVSLLSPLVEAAGAKRVSLKHAAIRPVDRNSYIFS